MAKRSPMSAPVGPPKKSDQGPRRHSSATVGQVDQFERVLRQERKTEKARTRSQRALAAERESRARQARAREPSRLPRTAPAKERSDRYTRLSNDARPASAGPRSVPRGRRRGSSSGLRKLSADLGKLGTRHPRQVLLAEGIGVATIVAVSRAADQQAPRLSDFVAPFVVFFLLSIMTEFGDQAARLASGLGALVFVATAMAHADALVKGTAAVASKPAGVPGKGE